MGAAWYVFGAQAVIIWGRPRLTADIDVTVRMDPEEPERLVRELESAGFRLRVAYPAVARRGRWQGGRLPAFTAQRLRRGTTP